MYKNMTFLQILKKQINDSFKVILILLSVCMIFLVIEFILFSDITLSFLFFFILGIASIMFFVFDLISSYVIFIFQKRLP